MTTKSERKEKHCAMEGCDNTHFRDGPYCYLCDRNIDFWAKRSAAALHRRHTDLSRWNGRIDLLLARESSKVVPIRHAARKRA